jgi:hypothetical protein
MIEMGEGLRDSIHFLDQLNEEAMLLGSHCVGPTLGSLPIQTAEPPSA